MNKKNFDSNEFQLDLISRGAYVDNGSSPEKSYLIETTVIRLNWVALNAWVLSITSNCRDCYETNEEWEAHRTMMGKKHDAVKTQIIDLLRVDPATGSVCITQSQSEIFTVVHISEITPKIH